MALSFSGDCTVERAEELKASLMEAIEAGAPIQLSFKDITGADSSFFQLLHATQRLCAERDLELSMAKDIPAELHQAAEFSGMGDLVANKDS